MFPHHRVRSSSVQSPTASSRGLSCVLDKASEVQALNRREITVNSDIHQTFYGDSITHSTDSCTLVTLSERIKSEDKEYDGRTFRARCYSAFPISESKSSPHMAGGNVRRGGFLSRTASSLGKKPPTTSSSGGIGCVNGEGARCHSPHTPSPRPLATVPPAAAGTDPFFTALDGTLATERRICVRSQAVLDIYADPETRWLLGGPDAQAGWRDGALRDIHESGVRVHAELARAAAYRGDRIWIR